MVDYFNFEAKFLSFGLSTNEIYTVYIKIRYNSDNHSMAGNQFGFTYKNINDLYNLLSNVKSKLNDCFEVYNIADHDVLYIQLSFRKTNIALLSKYKLDRTLTHNEPSIYNTINTDYVLNIPVSIDDNYLGKALRTEVDTDNNISYIDLNSNNFLDYIISKSKFLKAKHRDNIKSFDSSLTFHRVKDTKGDYVLAKKVLNNNTVEKIRYSLYGVILNYIVDTLLHNNIISRAFGKNIIHIKHD